MKEAVDEVTLKIGDFEANDGQQLLFEFGRLWVSGHWRSTLRVKFEKTVTELMETVPTLTDDEKTTLLDGVSPESDMAKLVKAIRATNTDVRNSILKPFFLSTNSSPPTSTEIEQITKHDTQLDGGNEDYKKAYAQLQAYIKRVRS